MSGPATGGGVLSPAYWRAGSWTDEAEPGRRERELILWRNISPGTLSLSAGNTTLCTDLYLASEHSLIMKSSKLISASSANFSYDNRDYSCLINLNMWRLPTKEKHHK